MNAYLYQQLEKTATNTVAVTVDVCDCNATSCPHWERHRIRIWTSIEAEAPPKPRPWIMEQIPVVPRLKKLGVAPWRPRQQRARDGI